MNKKELAEYLKVTELTIETNFPRLCAKQLKNGIKIIKTGLGEQADYQIEHVTPQEVESGMFSRNHSEIYYDLPNEVWKESILDKYEVSNLGRVRNKKNKIGNPGYLSKDGYLRITYKDKHYSIHRLILEAFDPIENSANYTVDHIDGSRTNNQINNLRWCLMEENIKFMILRRADLNKELTRLIQIYGYETTLNKLKSL